jgi:hypothetical protein
MWQTWRLEVVRKLGHPMNSTQSASSVLANTMFTSRRRAMGRKSFHAHYSFPFGPEGRQRIQLTHLRERISWPADEAVVTVLMRLSTRGRSVSHGILMQQVRSFGPCASRGGRANEVLSIFPDKPSSKDSAWKHSPKQGRPLESIHRSFQLCRWQSWSFRIRHHTSGLKWRPLHAFP